MKVVHSMAALIVMTSVALAAEPPRWVTDQKAMDHIKRQIRTDADIMRYSGWGADPNEATRNAEAEIARNLMSRYGVDCTVRNNEVSCGGDIVAKYKVEDKWVGPSRGSGNFVAYLLVQSTVFGGAFTTPLRLGTAEEKTIRKDTGLKPWIPGMAQLHKGENVKGVFFIVGMASSAGAAGVSELLRSDHAGKMKTSIHNPAAYVKHKDGVRDMEIVRNVAIGCGAAVYVWNVIDGYAAKGRARTHSLGANWELTPHVDPRSGGTGAVLTFNF